MGPKFKYKDKVKFTGKNYTTGIVETLHGEVYIVDQNGTWDNLNKEPSYDVYVESENMLYKHLTESQVFPDDGEDE